MSLGREEGGHHGREGRHDGCREGVTGGERV